MIESRLGLRVFLTRDDDRTMTLDERSAYANSQKADVFLSIHANAAVRPAMEGAEVYYLSSNPGERRGATARRIVRRRACRRSAAARATIDLILWETAQARYLDQSSVLAGLVEQALRPRVPMSPRAVQQAPFRVLVGANMPAVLVEVGYLSNAEQEQALAQRAPSRIRSRRRSSTRSRSFDAHRVDGQARARSRRCAAAHEPPTGHRRRAS